jgi:hypothetical protein
MKIMHTLFSYISPLSLFYLYSIYSHTLLYVYPSFFLFLANQKIMGIRNCWCWIKRNDTASVNFRVSSNKRAVRPMKGCVLLMLASFYNRAEEQRTTVTHIGYSACNLSPVNTSWLITLPGFCVRLVATTGHLSQDNRTHIPFVSL